MNLELNQYFNLLEEYQKPEFLNKYLSSKSLNRLKKVCYFCGMDYGSKDIYDFKEQVSRYDHSLSVALLTWKFTKDKKATLAALFHDIASPCFSHVIDYMNGDYSTQESTEEYTENKILNDTCIMSFLKEDGILPGEVSDFKKYSIVDNKRPKLCADRLDGIILTGMFWTKDINILDVKKIINDIGVFKNETGEKELGFYHEEIAKKVLEVSDNIDIYCHSKEDNFMMNFLAEITKEAIHNNYITYEQLYTLNEEELVFILKNKTNQKIKDLFQKFETITKEEIKDITLPYIKSRDLNPLVLGKRIKDEKVKRLSI